MGDLVTELQEQLSRVSAEFVNSTGEAAQITFHHGHGIALVCIVDNVRQ